MIHKTRANRVAATVAALSMLVQPTAHLVAATSQAQPPAKPVPAPAQAPAQPGSKPPLAAVAAATPKPIDGGWPRMYSLPSEGSILVYQPQISSWEKQSHMVAFSAVSYRSKSGEKPALGTIKIEADTKVALDDRLVSFQKMKIAEASFQTLSKEQVREIIATIDKAIPRRRTRDCARSHPGQCRQERDRAEERGRHQSRSAHHFLQQDACGGRQPRWRTDLEPDQGKRPEVRGQHELGPVSARSVQHVLPAQQRHVAESQRRQGTVDGRRQRCPTASPSCRPKTTGRTSRRTCRANRPRRFRRSSSASSPPSSSCSLASQSTCWSRARGLLWVSNTESDVFRMGKTGPVYYLVAGRWFSAPDFTGPWTFATPTLPEDFKKIPLEHDRSRVLASVPGTDQAAEAVLVAQIPQTARVNKKETKAPDVAFQGDPQFTPIEQTTVQRAVNTDKDVFKIGESYYMCYEGVWFVGKSASGPWEVASSVPQEIYKIPVSSPANHVTYVTIEDDDDCQRRLGGLCRGGRVHRDDDRVGLHGVGLGLVLSPVLRIWWLLSVLLPALPDLRVLSLVQPADGRLRAQRRRLRSRMAAPASPPATTRARAPTRVAPPPTVRTAHAVWRRPTTPGRGLTLRRVRAPTCTAAGVRPPCSAATTGQRRIATPTTELAIPRVLSGPTRAQASFARARRAGGSPREVAATSTPARTATSIGTG